MSEWTMSVNAVQNPELRVQIVHRADTEFPFLHDTMIAQLGGRLLLAWYNCSENEIVGRTVIRGRWSDDGGRTWSAPEIICEDVRAHRHMVPVTFAEQNGEIWAYVTKMTAHDRPTSYVCMQYVRGNWQFRSEVAVPVLFNTLPQRVKDRWIVGGRMAAAPGELPLIPIVATAVPASSVNWRITPLPGPWNCGQYPFQYPETALLVDGCRVDALVRNDAGSMVCFTSLDGGDTWGTMQACDMPIAPAKMYGGSLPDGMQYLIFNEITPAQDRSRLLLALRNGSGQPFSRAYILADGFHSQLNAGPYWHYPCACIADGWLHISCTASSDGVVRHAALFSLPLQAV